MLAARLVDDVLSRLGLTGRPRTDAAGLGALYGAWCDGVPFDNVQKLLHLRARRAGPLPGSTSDGFFADWLAHRTGGTCWSGNGALFDLLASLGFEAQRVAATMMPAADTPGPNHGSVVVSLDGDRWIVDASILSGAPLRLPRADETLPSSGALPRVDQRDDRACILWRTARLPDGMPCRIDEIGVAADRWNALHQATAAWGPFNFAVHARANRGARTIGCGAEARYEIDASGALTTRPLDRAGRDRFLIEELRVDPVLVRALPDDGPVPPRP